MSCIVGFINLDNESADPEILVKVCRPLQGRAPDDTNTWQRGSTGLGHALLATSDEEKTTTQPYTLDGETWVTSDAHLCGTNELEQKLRSAGVRIAADSAVPELLLQAYRTFGDAFAQHLVGDFALAVWDEQEKRLICARDHLGVRPLFYAHTNEVFVFGSDISALLAHPKISDELNDEYIADFLLAGASVNKEATAYKHIKRLPAAHFMTVNADRIRLHQYWSPPLHQTIRYSHAIEYTEHFAALFEKAVTERIPSTHVAVDLSGGMDSSSIAAVTAAYARDNGQQVTAYTNSCKALIAEDKEGYYAKMIAAHLHIPIQVFASEDYPLFDRFDSPVLRTAEPLANPGLAQSYDKAQRIIDSGCRVLLTGQMGDTLFAGSDTYFPNLLKTGRLIQLMSGAYVHKKHTGSLTGTGLRVMAKNMIRQFTGMKSTQPDTPGWINSSFATRIELEHRWTSFRQMWSKLNDTHGQLLRPWFSHFFESYNSAGLPLMVRHPFSDIRLVEYMLCIPNYMHHNKRVLREAMANRLPPEILSRPKMGLPGDLRRIKIERGLCRAIPNLEVTRSYIDIEKFVLAYEQFLKSSENDSTWDSWLINLPIALAYWMNNNKTQTEEKL